MPTYYLISPLTYGDSKKFALTYESATDLSIGQFVEVPILRKTSLGVVLGVTDQPTFATKPIASVDLPSLPPHLVELAIWMHDYYLASPKQIWQTILPAGLTKNRRQAKEAKKAFVLAKMELPLTTEQQATLAAIRSGGPGSYLLRGITGSGKTQVYIELALEQMAAGRSIIMLVPEIALTPQTIATFTAVFGDAVIPFHSGLTEAAKHAAWLAAYAPGPHIIIGPRSALFLPVSRPGLIVIDESHESTYKQDQNPRYQAEIVAAKLAGLTNATLVMGSATPSLFEIYMAKHGRITLLEMDKRANALPLPEISIIDARDKANFRRSKLLSEPLVEALSQTLDQGRQSLLFLNRRGSAASLLCNDCGFVFICQSCDVPMTFHADLMRLICHYCDRRLSPPAVCPECKGSNLRYTGAGTKRIEAELARLFPTARIARLDRDSATPDVLDETYRDLREHRIDLLVGTQMIAKGLDLPALDTVGIVSADTMLHLPDFTAAERTFQLLSQVAGRAGRGDRIGRVLVQSYTPGHPAITSAQRHEFWPFVEAELEHRKLLGYPPYVHLLKLSLGAKEDVVDAKAEQLAATLRRTGLTVLGPAPSWREKAGSKHFRQIIVKARSRGALLKAAALAGTEWTVDIDPINLL